MKKRYLLLAGIMLCVIPQLLMAQKLDELRITAQIQNQPLSAIFKKFEEVYPVRIFFQEKDLPTDGVTANFQDTPLPEVMEQLLGGTVMDYLMYRDFAVIIAPERILRQTYSADYYRALANNLEQEETEEVVQKMTIGSFDQLDPSGMAEVQGTILDSQTEEPIIGATVMWTELQKGTATDALGKFTSTVPTGEYEVLIQYVGYSDFRQNIQVYSDGTITIPLDKASIDLQEVVVEAEAANSNVANVQIGVDRLDTETIQKLPTFLGEADVVKTLLMNPGVSSVGEGATGFNVRGGEVDQNLMLQDEGFIFNASHALGFFSTFNVDLIRGVELYKGNIPAQFGGRLASVLDVEMRDGNFEKFKIKGGAGPVSSRISLEGPVVKGKSSFLVGFRSTYSDWVLRAINVREVQRSSAFFYDANLRYTHRIDPNNTITFAGYSSRDDFTYNEEFGFDYSTQMGQILYNKIFNNNLYNKLSVTASLYESTQTDFDQLRNAALSNDITYFKIKDHLTYNPQPNLRLDMGFSSIYYRTNPGEIRPLNENSQVIPEVLEEEKGLESAVFLNAQYEVSAALQMSGGLRLVAYQFLGAKTVNQYENDDPSSLENLIESEEQSGVIASYYSVEPRFSMRYSLNTENSLKAGYSRTAQFINQIFNTDTPTPTSQFQLSTNYIEPQRSHNFSLGFFKNINNNEWETSLEVFGRIIDEAFDYQDFAQLTMNPFLETEILSGEGRAGGVELSIKRKTGTWNGWMSYTLSRSERRIEGINNNDWYPSNFDKPHNMSLIVNYNPNQQHTVTINFNYSTGRPVNPPLGNYETNRGVIVPIFAERNQTRIPDYHRLDIAYTIGKGYRKTAKVKTSWTFSIYNVYGRKNAFSVFYTQGAFQRPQANQLAILGSAFPAVTFNLEIL